MVELYKAAAIGARIDWYYKMVSHMMMIMMILILFSPQ